ncbi:hypothetical protein ACWCWD_06480 [Streptomyces sp. NPDC001493]
MPAPTPAETLRAAATRARELGDPRWSAVARLLDGYGTDWDMCPADHPGTALDEYALAVARVVLGEDEAVVAAQPEAVLDTDLRDRIADVLWPLTDWDGDEANARSAAAAVLAVLPAPAERPLSPYYEHPECGFHWHGRDGMDVPLRDGQPVCPRCELRRLADEAQQPEAHRPATEFIAEVLESDGMWMYLGTVPDRAAAEKRCASVTRRHPGTETRIVRKATTYTVEPAGPVTHLSAGTNAEGCPACKGTNPPYPFLCPGQDAASATEEPK